MFWGPPSLSLGPEYDAILEETNCRREGKVGCQISLRGSIEDENSGFQIVEA